MEEKLRHYVHLEFFGSGGTKLLVLLMHSLDNQHGLNIRNYFRKKEILYQRTITRRSIQLVIVSILAYL